MWRIKSKIFSLLGELITEVLLTFILDSSLFECTQTHAVFILGPNSIAAINLSYFNELQPLIVGKSPKIRF